MGYQLVRRARWLARGLRSINAVLALLEMADTAKDDDTPPMYWAHWERTAVAIGFDLPPEPDPELVTARDANALAAVRRRKKAVEAVTKALGVLEEVGVIARARRKAPGRSTVWELRLEALNTPQGLGSEHSPIYGADTPQGLGSTLPKVWGQEEQEGSSTHEIEDADSVPEVTTVRARTRKDHGGWTVAHEFNDDGSGLSCEDCGLQPDHRRHRGVGAA